ncbi:MAG: S8 family peptidase [Chloroflexota bacterium]
MLKKFIYLPIYTCFIFFGLVGFSVQQLSSHHVDFNRADQNIQLGSSHTQTNPTGLIDAIDLSIETDDYGLLNVREGQRIRYTLHYQNIGEQAATDVVIRQRVPNFARYDPIATAELQMDHSWHYTDTIAGSILRADIGIVGSSKGGQIEVVFAMDEAFPLLAPEVTSEAIIESLSPDMQEVDLLNNVSTQTVAIGSAILTGILWVDADGDGAQGLNETVTLEDISLDVVFADEPPSNPSASIRITSTADGVFRLTDMIYDDYFINCLDSRCPYNSLFVRLAEVNGFSVPLKTPQEAQAFREQLHGPKPSSEHNQKTPIWFVHFVPHTSEQERTQILSTAGHTVDWWPQIDVALIEPTSLFDPRSLLRHESVQFVEPDSQVVGLGKLLQGQQRFTPLNESQTPPVEGFEQYVPNDPDLIDENLTYATDILQAFEAWSITTGSEEVIIAIVDSGVVTEHLDIEPSRILTGYDFVWDDDIPDDEHGHGTHIAGIIAATIDNEIGGSGICPQCKLLPIKVLDRRKAGGWSNISEGILYATDRGAQVINLSLGGQFPPEVLAKAVAYASENNVLMIGAGGNTGFETIIYPAAYEGVIGVGATNNEDQRWSLSSTGPHIELSAPGQSIYSTWGNIHVGSDAEDFVFLSGTSMAAPHVTAIAGLLLSQDSSLTPETIRQLLIASSTDLGETALDEEYGYGRVNALRALLLLLNQTVYLPVVHR